MTKTIILAVVIVLVLIVGFSSIYVVRENTAACTFLFSEFVNTVDTPGLHF